MDAGQVSSGKQPRLRKPNEGDKVTDPLLLVTAALWAVALFVVALIPLFVACGGQSDEPGPAATATQTLPLTASLTHPPTATPTPSPTATATPSPSPSPTPTPTPTPQAEFQLSGCEFEAPDTVDVLCGYLIVPEDRSDPDSQPISLHVAVFTSESEEPAPDPIVYLEGGPGGHALEIVPFIFEDRIAPFLTNRHFIVFDQRGVGYSEPNLDCPELIALTHETLDQQLSVEEQRAGGLSASLACRDRLIGEGVNLKAYTSAENAADLNALRQALGYEEWNLYGISYGTRLALTAMRDHPEGIRSVVLDSAYPLQVDLPTSLLSNADRAFSQLFGACRENPACSGAYPNLESTFFELVQRLNADPVVITITDPLSGEVLDYLLDGDRLMSFLFQSLYSELLIPLLPELIFDVEGGTYDQIGAILGLFQAQTGFTSHGMYDSVQCGEEVPFSSRDVPSNQGPYRRSHYVRALRVLGGPQPRCHRESARQKRHPSAGPRRRVRSYYTTVLGADGR